MSGEERTFTYEGRAFGESGGPDSLPRLWATRKIGHLLREVRLDGPNDELIDQIVRLSIRYGIVTPYTSYLVTEDAPFGEDDACSASRTTPSEYAATTTAPSTGEAAVNQADTEGGLAGSDYAAAPSAEYQDLVRTAGSRAFRLAEGIWTDTAFDPAGGHHQGALPVGGLLRPGRSAPRPGRRPGGGGTGHRRLGRSGLRGRRGRRGRRRLRRAARDDHDRPAATGAVGRRPRGRQPTAEACPPGPSPASPPASALVGLGGTALLVRRRRTSAGR